MAIGAPQTLIDVMLNQQQVSQSNTDQPASDILAMFVPINDSVTMSDTMSITTSINPKWDEGYWGNFVWS